MDSRRSWLLVQHAFLSKQIPSKVAFLQTMLLCRSEFPSKMVSFKASAFVEVDSVEVGFFQNRCFCRSGFCRSCLPFEVAFLSQWIPITPAFLSNEFPSKLVSSKQAFLSKWIPIEVGFFQNKRFCPSGCLPKMVSCKHVVLLTWIASKLVSFNTRLSFEVDSHRSWILAKHTLLLK